MSEQEQLVALMVALAVGLLIGIERGWSGRETASGKRVAGVRSYALLGLLGGIAGLVAEVAGGLVIGFAGLAVAAGLVSAHQLSHRDTGDPGITSFAASLVAFGLGALAGQGHLVPAAAAGVATTLLLGFKPELHRWVEGLSQTELRAGMTLAVMSVVLLPVLPNRGYGPWDALNPYQIWWMVVLIAAISFVGYFAVKVFGAGRGIPFTGLFGGLASSTALTLHFSRTARGKPAIRGLLGAGVLLACGTMFPRLLLIVGLLNPVLLATLFLPIGVMAAIVYAAAGLLWWRNAGHKNDSDAVLTNPLEIGSALSFGALLALVLLLAKGLNAWFGDAGVLALAAISGIADVDAISLSLARMSTDDLGQRIAVVGIVIAAASNSLVKAAMAVGIGGGRFGLKAALPLTAAAVVGVALAWTATPGGSGG